MKYEDIVKTICGDNWRSLDQDEKDGGYGVACMLAFMRGAEPVPVKVAAHLGIPVSEIQTAYTRLDQCGLFSKEFDARKDKWLLGQGNSRQNMCAWGYVAGLSSGMVSRCFGRSYN